MTEKRDYSLLRPFDLEAAKRGEGVLWNKHPVRWVDLAEAPRNQLSIVEHGCGLSYATKDELCMAPMFWVEGRPVYKGDTLYLNKHTISPGRNFVVASTVETMAYSKDGTGAGIECFTWTEPNPILCEVEGKPVRKGDRLWSFYFDDWFVVDGCEPNSLLVRQGVFGKTYATSCAWNRPPKKVKKQGFINIYPPAACHGTGAVASVATAIYKNKGMADALMTSNRIACLQVEWEEEVSE